MKKNKFKIHILLSLLILSLTLTGCTYLNILKNITETSESTNISSIESKSSIIGNNVSDDIPAYSEDPYVEVNSNKPYFTAADYTTQSFEYYSDLDSLGRCGVAYANIGQDIMPTEKRGNIGTVKPSGWHTIKYDFIDGKYLYNRCHLIAYELSSENANEKNLITGTRYLNINGMLPYENKVAAYIKKTNNHVLYRVTPTFTEKNLIANGVLMEGYSVEDNGAGICFNVFVYNVQPGVVINYLDGTSTLVN